jgi:hypothetical protein
MEEQDIDHALELWPRASAGTLAVVLWIRATLDLAQDPTASRALARHSYPSPSDPAIRKSRPRRARGVF